MKQLIFILLLIFLVNPALVSAKKICAEAYSKCIEAMGDPAPSDSEYGHLKPGTAYYAKYAECQRKNSECEFGSTQAKPQDNSTAPVKSALGTRVYLYDFNKSVRTGEELVVPESKNHCLKEQSNCVTNYVNKHTCNSSYFEKNPNVTLEECRKGALLNEQRCQEEMVRCVKAPVTEGSGKPKPTSEPGKTEKETQCPGAHQEYDSDLKECVCGAGYWQRPDGICRKSVTDKLRLDVESAIDVEELIDTLETNNRQMITLTLQNGETMRLGVIKLGNGGILFTKDGERFYQNLGHTIQPSFMRRAFRGVGNFANRLSIFRWFHVSLPDKHPGEDREKKWQIAQNVLDDLKEMLKKEKELAEYMNDVREKIVSHKDNLEEIEAILRAGGESEEIIRTIKSMGVDELKDFLKGKLISFPADVIEKLFSQLNTDDFADAVRVYTAERENYSPEQIFDNPPPELTDRRGASVAREYDLGKRLLYTKYEEAYQRYLLSKEFNK